MYFQIKWGSMAKEESFDFVQMLLYENRKSTKSIVFPSVSISVGQNRSLKIV